MARAEGRTPRPRRRGVAPAAAAVLAAVCCLAAPSGRAGPGAGGGSGLGWATLAGSRRSAPLRHRPGPRVAAAAASLEVEGDLEPISDYLLIKPKDAVEKTKGGILLPTSSSNKPSEGTVLAAGPGKVDKDGRKIPVWSEVGMQVLFGKYGAEKVELKGEEHLLLRDSDVFLSFVGEEPSLETLKVPPGKVLVKLKEEESQTEGGLFLSKGASKPETEVGEVVAAAEGAWNAAGELVPLGVAVGDSVRFRYGDEVGLEVGNAEYRIVDADDCLAKWRAP